MSTDAQESTGGRSRVALLKVNFPDAQDLTGGRSRFDWRTFKSRPFESQLDGRSRANFPDAQEPTFKNRPSEVTR